MEEHTVIINGTVYDKRTGKPLRAQRDRSKTPPHSARTVHASLQKSSTLNRRYVHRVERQTDEHAIRVHTKRAITPAITKSEHITRFAPTESNKKPVKPIARQAIDIAPTKHHLVNRAEQRVAAKQPEQRTLKPSDILKREAIAEATNRMPARHSKKPIKVQKKRSTLRRFASIGTISLAVLILGAYFTYLNMPTLSTRVAASQAGINASYPAYNPTGYSLSGPVAFQQGSVQMKFAANASPDNYTLSQTHSDWDSSAVLDNYITPKAGSDYTTTTTGGLTIYTYNKNAAWVNRGILYTIEGNAPLSNDQIQRIATSL